MDKFIPFSVPLELDHEALLESLGLTEADPERLARFRARTAEVLDRAAREIWTTDNGADMCGLTTNARLLS